MLCSDADFAQPLFCIGNQTMHCRGAQIGLGTHNRGRHLVAGEEGERQQSSLPRKFERGVPGKEVDHLRCWWPVDAMERQCAVVYGCAAFQEQKVKKIIHSALKTRQRSEGSCPAATSPR
jgi:hypothetical protein